MKKILIPTDFSDNAGDALAYALKVFGKYNPQIHILHVVDVNVVPSEIPITNVDLIGPRLENARASMRALEEFGKLFYEDDKDSNIQISTNVTVGTIPHNIKEEAKKVNADMIIMGTQGTNHSVMEKVIGTVSTATLNHAPCPIILIPRDYKFKPIDNMIFASNMDSGDPYELWRATELMKPHVGQVRCVYVVKDPGKINTNKLEEFAKYMVEHSPSIQTMFNVEEGKNVEAVLAEYADTYDAELIIMHRSKKSFLDRVFTTRHTAKMASWIQVPLLVMNEQS